MGNLKSFTSDGIRIRLLSSSWQAVVRQTSNCHKSVKFAIYCAAYQTESLISLVFLSFFFWPLFDLYISAQN